MQLQHGIHQVGGDLNGITWDGLDAGFNDGNTYALRRPGGIILVDCGCGDTIDQIRANMRYWGLDPATVRYCLLTHAHLDHAGAAHILKNEGVKLVAHEETAEAIAVGDERCCGYLYHKEFVPCTVDITVCDGDTLSLLDMTFSVMHLPGHTMGCTAYFFEHEGRRIVFSGDIIGTLLAGDFGWSGSIDFDKPTYLESLRRFATADMDLMLPGHGMAYFHDPRRRVEEALNSALMQWR